MENVMFLRQQSNYNKVNDLFINKNMTIEKACKKIGISNATYYRVKKLITEKNSEMKQQTGGNLNSNVDNINNVNVNNHANQFRQQLAKDESVLQKAASRKH